MIKIDRIYAKPADLNGVRILVDRVWPRGVSKASAHLDYWMKDVAPTTELRKWFAHDPAKYAEFRDRYREELKTNPALDELKDVVKANPDRPIILLYGAKDTAHNHALVLQEVLE
ncbi:MAG: DUF488 family protein [Limosilactobacillus sp.]|uniref:DUF488 domain-containing protein n=1 Tax=Limosilactobacillus sp. TaxID=2773925 RepID=UPI002709092A|nr:DUF488 family protein [Limosilactobacillus sp.]